MLGGMARFALWRCSFSLQEVGSNGRQGCSACALTSWGWVVRRCGGPGASPAPLLVNLKNLGVGERAGSHPRSRFQPEPTRWRCREASPRLWAGTPG